MYATYTEDVWNGYPNTLIASNSCFVANNIDITLQVHFLLNPYC